MKYFYVCMLYNVRVPVMGSENMTRTVGPSVCTFVYKKEVFPEEKELHSALKQLLPEDAEWMVDISISGITTMTEKEYNLFRPDGEPHVNNLEKK